MLIPGQFVKLLSKRSLEIGNAYTGVLYRLKKHYQVEESYRVGAHTVTLPIGTIGILDTFQVRFHTLDRIRSFVKICIFEHPGKLLGIHKLVGRSHKIPFTNQVTAAECAPYEETRARYVAKYFRNDTLRAAEHIHLLRTQYIK